MKKFTIQIDYHATIKVEILAESENEALNKARQVEIEKRELEIEKEKETVIEDIDVQDLQTLIEQAENIMMKAEEEGIEIELNSWQYVTLEFWDGDEFVNEKRLIEHIYWDTDAYEICFSTTEGGEGFCLSEIPEIEQFNVCNAIIDSNK